MRNRIETAAVRGALLLALGLVADTALAGPEGPAFPGNEAVKIVNGKRIVEAPPLTAATQRYIKGGGKLPPPTAGGEVFMIESASGLMECRSVYLSETGCIPSTLGTSQRSRLWTVKLKGQWLHCESRSPNPKCEPASGGVPGGMGTVE